MDDYPICGTVWPGHLIDIILHHRGPSPDPWKVQLTDAIFVAVNLYHTAPFVTDESASREIQRMALNQLKNAVAQFEQEATKEIAR